MYNPAKNIITHLLWDPASKLPPNASLHREHDILHLDLSRPSRMFRVHKRIRKNLRCVPVREFE